MKLYEKTYRTHEMRANHFYSAARFIFFGRLIFTIDVYPETIHFGVMWAYSSWQKTIWRLS